MIGRLNRSLLDMITDKIILQGYIATILYKKSLKIIIKKYNKKLKKYIIISL